MRQLHNERRSRSATGRANRTRAARRMGRKTDASPVRLGGKSGVGTSAAEARVSWGLWCRGGLLVALLLSFLVAIFYATSRVRFVEDVLPRISGASPDPPPTRTLVVLACKASEPALAFRRGAACFSMPFPPHPCLPWPLGARRDGSRHPIEPARAASCVSSVLAPRVTTSRAAVRGVPRGARSEPRTVDAPAMARRLTRPLPDSPRLRRQSRPIFSSSTCAWRVSPWCPARRPRRASPRG